MTIHNSRDYMRFAERELADEADLAAEVETIQSQVGHYGPTPKTVLQIDHLDELRAIKVQRAKVYATLALAATHQEA